MMKAQDSLIGVKKDFGLPKIDITEPRIRYRYVESLRTAPESVKKIFSIEYGERIDLNEAWKSETAKSILGHDYDKMSRKSKSTFKFLFKRVSRII